MPSRFDSWSNVFMNSRLSLITRVIIDLTLHNSLCTSALTRTFIDENFYLSLSHTHSQPPPPSPSQAPPSYDSLSDHGTHIHSIHPRYHFTNPSNTADSALDPTDPAELELNRLSHSEDVCNDNSVEGLISDHFDTTEDRPNDPPPPYSPGLRYIRAVSGFGNVFVTDPPPSYNSVFGQIREAREHSQSNWAFFKRLSEIILNTGKKPRVSKKFMHVHVIFLLFTLSLTHTCSWLYYTSHCVHVSSPCHTCAR